MKIYYEVAAVKISGIKCDTAGCDWSDDFVPSSDYQNWLNRPCPKCSGNLLTQKDLTAFINMISVVDKLNSWCNKWLPEFLLRMLSSNKKKHKIDMDGSGRINL